MTSTWVWRFGRECLVPSHSCYWLLSQRRDGIDVRRTSRGKVTRQKRDRDEASGDDEESHWIVDCDAEQDRAQEFREERRGDQSGPGFPKR